MSLQYFEKWFFRQKTPILPLDATEAERRHIQRSHYVAVIANEEKPQFVVDLAGDWVSVLFLDDQRRIYLEYHFKDLLDGQIFLTNAVHREFEGNRDDVTFSTTFQFDRDGKVLMEKRDFRSSVVDEREANFDPSKNLEKYPAFGAYATLCRTERDR
jgi:hypothetical protein